MILAPHLKCLKLGIIVMVQVVMAPQISDQFLQRSKRQLVRISLQAPWQGRQSLSKELPLVD